MPSLSRNGTVLLQLKRCHVSQRLNELQIMLGQIRRCQQCDSKSKDGTRGRTQTDSSTTQQGWGEHYPDIDGCSPTVGRQQDSIPANQNHSQKTVMSTSLGNHKLESHISDLQKRDSVQNNNPDTLLDSETVENQLHLNEQGQQESGNSQITIENTTGHTDIDDMWGAATDQKII